MPAQDYPLVSVIIPCYNHGAYLPEAIASIIRQTYKNIQIIVVDDGSTDNTKTVAGRYPEVKYIYQNNQGLSAARNTGVLNSSGDFLVFLDADDLLYYNAVEYNLEHLLQNPAAAFVSGASLITTLNKRELGEKKVEVTSDHYLHLLKSNYIGMHGTVMYQRQVFDEFTFDVSLKACEDYDLYLKVARKYPVIHHTKKVAVYRMHDSNMSGNTPMMLEAALAVLARQKPGLTSATEKAAYKEGVRGYKNYYGIHLFVQLKKSKKKVPKELVAILRKHNPKYYLRYRIGNIIMNKKTATTIKKMVPASSLRFLYKLGFYKSYQPVVGKVDTGDFYRTTPFSKCFGYNRGGAIDRYYIENFLESEADSIRERVLEIGDNDYTLRFGQANVKQSEILHVDNSNPQATIVGDLSNAPHIPDNSFDCIILTQTLHLVYDYKAVVSTCYRILKPGGTLLLTVPGITPIDYDEWEKSWLWSFTGRVIEKILAETFSINYLEVNTHGNVFVAAAFLYGMGLPEIKKEMLDFHDPHMQVVITAKAVKKG